MYFNLKSLLLRSKYGDIKLTFLAVQMQGQFIVAFFASLSPSLSGITLKGEGAQKMKM